MHASSFENMALCQSRYIAPAMADRDEVLVVDIGGADVNGGYRPLFSESRYNYQAVDIEAAEGVDVVLEDPYVLPYEDHSVDVVLSGQMLEHCEFFWLTFQEMMRVLRKDGLLVLIAPSGGPIHQYPVDCYRFYPDGYRALAKYAGCEVVDLWHDERGPWRDLVGVFSWQPISFAPAPAVLPVPSSTYDRVISPLGTDEEERTSGAQSYLDVLTAAHEVLAPRLYLEIGVRHGRSLQLARGPALGIDPTPEITAELASSVRIVTATSDQYFSGLADQGLANLDLAFIDGMHLFDYALRDFMNIERRAHAGTLVVIDDVLPGHPAQAERDRRTRVWTGDIWKLAALLTHVRPDLTLVTLDTAPTGLLLIAGLDPSNRLLWDQYNPLVRQWSAPQDPPDAVVQRASAVPPDAPEVMTVLRLLQRCRTESRPTAAVQRLLREQLTEVAPR